MLINCHYPVSADKFVLQYGMIVKKSKRTRGRRRRRDGQELRRLHREGFEQDIEIWKNKTRIENPLLCEEDGPVYQLRRWYEQFYVDVADVTPRDDRTVRVRTRHHPRPVESWKKEVEETSNERRGNRCNRCSALSAARGPGPEEQLGTHIRAVEPRCPLPRAGDPVNAGAARRPALPANGAAP